MPVNSPVQPETSSPAPSSRTARRAKQGLTVGALLLTLGALPGCQSISGSPQLALVRVIDASPDAPVLDVYQNSVILANNLGLGTYTSYVQTAPGTYNLNVDVAGSKQQLVTARGTFNTGSQYTVLIADYTLSLSELVLKDQTQPAPSGQVSLRFVDEATRGGAVDLYLIPAGSTLMQVRPVLVNVTFGNNSGYVNFPTGTYTLAALPTGTVATASTATLITAAAAVSYTPGSARTVVLIDQGQPSTPGVRVVIVDDYDPAGASS